MSIKNDNIMKAFQNNKNVLMNVVDFYNIVNDNYPTSTNRYLNQIEVITDKKIVRNGLVATIENNNCWISYTIKPGFIRVSNKPIIGVKVLHNDNLEEPKIQNDDEWSKEIDLEQPILE